MTSVHALVYRDLYRGRIVGGKTRRGERAGTKVKRKRPESERLAIKGPELRIVSGHLWNAAHARLDRTREAYKTTAHGRLWGRPESGLEVSRYLLTGFLQCGVCTAGMQGIRRTSRGGGPRAYYVCPAHRERGNITCPNDYSAPLEALPDGVLGTFPRDTLVPDVVEEIATTS